MNARKGGKVSVSGARLWAIVLVCGSLGLAVAALSQQLGNVVAVDEPVAVDQYLAGQQVTVTATVDGDLVAAGSLVRINGAVTGDVIAAGESVTISEPVGDDVRIAGQNLALDSNVGGHVVAAGNSIALAKDAEVTDWLWAAGNTVAVAGRVGGELRAAASTVVISGEIGGNADVAAETLEIPAGARIGGDLIWRSPNAPDISPQAMIAGEITERPELSSEDDGVGGGLLLRAALIVAVVIVLWLFPTRSAGIAQRIKGEPLKALAAGLAVLLLVPLVGVLITVTGVGAIVGVGTLLAYLLLLLVSWLMACAALGLLGLNVAGRDESGLGLKLLAAAIAALVVMLVGLIPVLGGLLVLLLWLLGLGALGLELAHAYRSRERSASS